MEIINFEENLQFILIYSPKNSFIKGLNLHLLSSIIAKMTFP